MVKTAGSVGSIPGWGTKILHATWCSQKKKERKKEKKRNVPLIFRPWTLGSAQPVTIY